MTLGGAPFKGNSNDATLNTGPIKRRKNTASEALTEFERNLFEIVVAPLLS